MPNQSELRMLALGRRGKKDKEAAEPGKVRVRHKPTGEMVVVNDDPHNSMLFKLMRHGESKQSGRDMMELRPSAEYQVKAPPRAYAWLCYHHN